MKHRGGERLHVGALGTLLLLTAGACGGTPNSDAAPDPFAGTPADAPFPEIGPAPDDYRPTAAGAPSTDVWIGRLVREGEALRMEGLRNATDRDGYDNQPSFGPEGRSLYYVSAVDTTQTEVFRYDMDGGARAQVTRTPDASEFSPNSIPGQDAISVIREHRGVQHLWRYAADGRDLGPIFSTAEPVGYHAWADERRTAMFILGAPQTLHVGDAISGELRRVADDPGRSIHRIPGTQAISFVRKVPDEEWWIERLDVASGESERIVRTLPGREDYAWTPSGEILMGDGVELRRWRADLGWDAVSGVDGPGVISRIAVSPDGARIAIVGARTRDGG